MHSSVAASRKVLSKRAVEFHRYFPPFLFPAACSGGILEGFILGDEDKGRTMGMAEQKVAVAGLPADAGASRTILDCLHLGCLDKEKPILSYLDLCY